MVKEKNSDIIQKMKKDKVVTQVKYAKSIFEIEKVIKIWFLINNRRFYNIVRGREVVRILEPIDIDTALCYVILCFECYFWYFKNPVVNSDIILILKEEGYDELAEVLENESYLNLKKEQYYALLMK